MIKVICYSSHSQIFILGSCDSLHHWTKPIKMFKNQDYFEYDFLIHDPNLEFKFKTEFEWETCNNKHFAMNPQDNSKVIICNFNRQEYRTINTIFFNGTFYNSVEDPTQQYIEFKDQKIIDIVGKKSNFFVRFFNGKVYFCIPSSSLPNFGKEGKGNEEIKKLCNIKKNRCFICGTYAEYNYEGANYGLYCDKHKFQKMQAIKITKSSVCTFLNCKVKASFGYRSGEPLFCTKHKINDMTNVSKLKCAECNNLSLYNYKGEKKMYCKDHKKEGMVNSKAKICKTEMCDTQVSKKYEGYCFRCFVHLFPEKSNARNYKTKEVAVADYVKNKFPDLNWICDKRSGASGRRPDLLCDLGDQIIIIEVDENAHNSEEYCSCENKRIMQISQDLGHKPIIFIRFNPDSFSSLLSSFSLREKEKSNNEGLLCEKEKSENDGAQKKISGCWKLTKTGLQTVANKKKWEERLAVLADTIEYWFKNRTNKTVEQIFLFYNGFMI